MIRLYWMLPLGGIWCSCQTFIVRLGGHMLTLQLW